MKLTPQEESILAHLRRGQHITPLEALGVYGVFRLGARIFNIKAYLEQQGTGETIATTRARDGKGKHYARYSLVKAEPKSGTTAGKRIVLAGGLGVMCPPAVNFPAYA